MAQHYVCTINIAMHLYSKKYSFLTWVVSTSESQGHFLSVSGKDKTGRCLRGCSPHDTSSRDICLIQ